MKLSAPIYRLKRQARLLSRETSVAYLKALDQIAIKEGFGGWSALAAQLSKSRPAHKLFSLLKPGDMVLLGARPGHGKTMMGLELLIEASQAGQQGVFYTLEYTESDAQKQLQSIGSDRKAQGHKITFETSNEICAPYIVEQQKTAPQGTVIVIDYLQLLDQNRKNPELSEQIKQLNAFARKSGTLIILISQIDRTYDPAIKSVPDLSNVRLPNPIDLGLFNKTCFLNDGIVQFDAVA